MKETLASNIEVSKISVKDTNGKQYDGWGVNVSWEGGALLTVEGYNFKKLENNKIFCVVQDTYGNKFKTEVVKDKSTCSPTDYKCLYSEVSYKYTNSHLGCYTPYIPPKFRKPVEKQNYMQMRFYLESDAGHRLTTKNPAWSTVAYRYDWYPELRQLEPRHLIAGDPLRFFIRPTNAYPKNRLDQIQFGHYKCMTEFGEDFYQRYHETFFECKAHFDKPQYIPVYRANFMTGNMLNSEIQTPNKVDLTMKAKIQEYVLKVYPKIESVSSNSGTKVGGQILTINGKGFGLNIANTIVKIHDDSCVVSSVTETQIICKTSKSTYDKSKVSKFIASPGLRKKIWHNIRDMNRLLKTPGYPNTGFAEDTNTLEFGSGGRKKVNKRGYIYEGYFKALYEGKYRFYVTTRGHTTINLLTGVDKDVKKQLYNFWWSTDYPDPFSRIESPFPMEKTRSDWIDLKKGEYYPIESIQAIHGTNWFQLGVEIKPTVPSTETELIANEMLQVQRLRIQPKAIARDIYEMKVTTLTGNWELSCKSGKGNEYIRKKILLSHNAGQARNEISQAFQDGAIIVRKVPINKSGAYFLKDKVADASEDATHNADRKFDDFFYSKSDTKDTKDKIYTTTSSGQKAGYAFLVIVDRYQRDIKHDYNDECYFKIDGSSKQHPVKRLQKRSDQMSGKYTLEFTDPDTNEKHVTPDIDIWNDYQWHKMYMDQIAFLYRKYDVYQRNDWDIVTIYIQLKFKSKVSFKVKTTNVTGGKGGKVDNSVTDFIPVSKNLFFNPIPPDMLFMKNFKPQISLTSEGIQATCPHSKCDYDYIEDLPEITKSEYDAGKKELSVTLGKAFTNETIAAPTIFLGDSPCGTATKTDLVYKCILRDSDIIAGNSKPTMFTSFGTIPPVNSINDVVLPLTITSVTPNKGSNLGGTDIKIVGTGFPTTLTGGFVVKIGNNECLITKLSKNEIQCLTGKKLTEDKIVMTYNGASLTSNKFSYVSKVSKNLSSTSPTSLSPGEKQEIILTFDGELNSYKTENMSVMLQSTTDATYQVKMNPFAIDGKKLKVKYSGAKPGSYKLYVKLSKDITVEQHPSITVSMTITSINPTSGSTNGGTEITVKGTNFLKAQLNQVLYIGNTPCTYISNTITEIKCRTNSPKNPDESIDIKSPVVIDQMIQYSSECKTNNKKCEFSYLTSKTPIITKIENDKKAYTFKKGEAITITGSNFNLNSVPSQITFDWGVITVTSSNKNTEIKGTIKSIAKYGVHAFVYKNSKGFAINKPETQMLDDIYIILQRDDPVISGYKGATPSDYGNIISLFTDTTDMYAPGNILNVCDKTCTFVETTMVPLTNAENPDKKKYVQCVMDYYYTPVKCAMKLSYYGAVISLNDKWLISRDNKLNTGIREVHIDGKNANVVKDYKITDTSNFEVTVQMHDKDETRVMYLLVNNKYSFKSEVPKVENNRALYAFKLLNGLPAGKHKMTFFQLGKGYLWPPSSDISRPGYDIKITPAVTEVKAINYSVDKNKALTSSFNGGEYFKIIGKNFNELISTVDKKDEFTSTPVQKINVCGLNAKILNSKSTELNFRAPFIMNYNFFKSKTIFKDDTDILEHGLVSQYYLGSTDAKPKLFDDSPFTKVDLTVDNNDATKRGFLGVKMNSDATDFEIHLGHISIFMGQDAKPTDLHNGYLEGSQDGTTYTKIMDMPTNLPFAWYRIDIDYKNVSGKKTFKYIRLVTQIATQIAEIRWFGHIVYNSNKELDCKIQITDAYNKFDLAKTIKYSVGKTLILTSISPESGSALGGGEVTFTLPASFTPNGDVKIQLYGQDMTNVRVTGTVIKAIIPKKDDNNYDKNCALNIYIPGYGSVYLENNQFYQYLDRWSDTKTWGGDFVPDNGETAYIKNTNVLLDQNINMNTIVIENGSLIVEDKRDYDISAKIILVRSGLFQVGTEAKPFQNKFKLTLKGTRQDPTLPMFGNKVLAILEGVLDLHGIERKPCWTFLSKTTDVGATEITLSRDTDWKIGEEIVIATSAISKDQTERRLIKSIKSQGGKSVITLDKPLKFGHYGAIETWGTNDKLDMRAEVGLLNRNIIVQGDDTSESNQYGSHIMLTSMEMNKKQSKGRVENVELRHCGQAFQMGRYPIHFHMMGNIMGSYVKNSAVHDTFNRAITIHGVQYFLVENNIAYNTMGHTFFVEDSAETYNTIKNNLALVTKQSFSLLNKDYHPSSFWITNPLNFVEGNHAAGSEHYGFWMDFPVHPQGMHLGSKMFVREMQLGSFKNNVAHSNGFYGLRIFPEFNPKTVPGQPVDGVKVKTVPTILDGLTVYKNGERGFITERVGNLKFKNFKAADNMDTGLEVSDTLVFEGGQAGFENCFVVGHSKNLVKDKKIHTWGLVTPRYDNFLVSDVRFYSFDDELLHCLSNCSRCEVSENATDSGARTIKFEKIKFDGTEKSRVRWTLPKRAIFRDLDGSLTGQSGPGWLTPYWKHNDVPACKATPIYEGGLVCDNTIQIRRIAFSAHKPNIFEGQNLNIQRLGSIKNLKTSDYTQYTKATMSAIPFKNREEPKGWAVPFVTNYNYLLSWGVGLNFEKVLVERSPKWEAKDYPINLVFNYTYRKDDWDVKGKNSTNQLVDVKNITDFSKIAPSTEKLGTATNNIPFGTFYNDQVKKLFFMRINGLEQSSIKKGQLTVTNIQCWNNDCGTVKPDDKDIETDVRKWSEAKHWPNNKVPGDGDNVEVKAGWNMVLDTPTAKLNELKINGRLSFDATKDNLEIKAHIIFVKTGELIIGTEEKRHTLNAKITLLGTKFSNNLFIDGVRKLPQKVLANINKMSIYGANRGPYTSKLKSSVKKDDLKILVDISLNWVKGDEIVIGTTSHVSNETERFTIQDYNKNTGEITLNNKIKFSHFGGISHTKIPDNFIKGAHLDERADIAMITRNIRIQGSDEEMFFGCNVFTTDYKTNEFTYSGNTNITDTEFVNCGQKDTLFGALQFDGSKVGKSLINGVSFHDNPYTNIKIVDSRNVDFKDVVLFQPKQFGVYVDDSKDINLDSITALNSMNRYIPYNEKLSEAWDDNGCFFICPKDNDSKYCENVNLKNSICGGSEYLGIVERGYDCNDKNYLKGYNQQFNKVYATNMTAVFIVTKGHTCTKAGNYIVYNNKNAGVTMSIKGADIILDSVISSNNDQGIIMNTGGSKSYSKKILQNSIVMGMNPENPSCLAPPNMDAKHPSLTQMGVVLSSTAGSGLKLPLTPLDIPLYKPMNDAKLESEFNMNKVLFYSWEDQCPKKSVAIHGNDESKDFGSFTIMKDIMINRVLTDNFMYIPPLDWSHTGDPCGFFPCTGPNNLAIQLKNFLKTTYTHKESDIKVNTKWKGAKKSYLQVDQPLKFSNSTETIKLEEDTTFIPVVYKGINKLPYCTKINDWNAVYCKKERKMGMLVFRNVDPEANMRSIAPIYVRNKVDGYVNKMNSFMDHGCENGYPTFLRTPVFPTLITLGKDYEIDITSSSPSSMTFKILDVDHASAKRGSFISYNFTSPQTILVMNGKTEIKSKQFKENEELTERKCGANKWEPVKNTLHFYIDNSPDCNIRLKTINSIQMNLRLSSSVDEFFSTNSSNELIYSIAAVLGIPANQIRISNVKKGSVILLLHIMESDPDKVIEETASEVDAADKGKIPDKVAVPKINLTHAVSSVATNINSGNLTFYAPILNLDYEITDAKPNNSTSNSTKPAHNKTVIIIDVKNNTDKNGSDIIPQPTPSDSKNHTNGTDIDVIEEDGMTGLQIGITIGLSILGACLIIACIYIVWYCYRKKEQEKTIITGIKTNIQQKKDNYEAGHHDHHDRSDNIFRSQPNATPDCRTPAPEKDNYDNSDSKSNINRYQTKMEEKPEPEAPINHEKNLKYELQKSFKDQLEKKLSNRDIDMLYLKNVASKDFDDLEKAPSRDFTDIKFTDQKMNPGNTGARASKETVNVDILDNTNDN